VRANSLKIGAQEFGDRRRRLRREDTGDPLAPFRRARRLVAGKIISARPGMGVDEAKGRFLALEMKEDARQNRVLEDVGEIAGVKGVSIVDLKRPRCGRAASYSVTFVANLDPLGGR